MYAGLHGTYVDENHALRYCHEAIEVHKDLKAVKFIVAVNEELLDGPDSELINLESDLVRPVSHKSPREGDDTVGPGRREENQLSRFGDQSVRKSGYRLINTIRTLWNIAANETDSGVSPLYLHRLSAQRLEVKHVVSFVKSEHLKMRHIQ